MSNPTKEAEIFWYGKSLSQLKSQVKDCVKELIESAIADSKKKLTKAYPEDKVNPALEKMKEAYLSSLEENSSGIEDAVDSAFPIPPPNGLEKLLEDRVQGIPESVEDLQLKLVSLLTYQNELLKMEAELNNEKDVDFSDVSQNIEALGASAQQRLNDMELVHDLFAANQPDHDVDDLRRSVQNMSFG